MFFIFEITSNINKSIFNMKNVCVCVCVEVFFMLLIKIQLLIKKIVTISILFVFFEKHYWILMSFLQCILLKIIALISISLCWIFLGKLFSGKSRKHTHREIFNLMNLHCCIDLWSHLCWWKFEYWSLVCSSLSCSSRMTLGSSILWMRNPRHESILPSTSKMSSHFYF